MRRYNLILDYMIFLLVFFIEIAVLFLLARAIAAHLSVLVHKVSGSSKVVAFVLAVLFLPGTFVHELSHYLMAVILRVRVGKFTLFPKAFTDQIILGSVSIVKTDPIRRFLIGIAPFIVGTLMLLIGIDQMYIFKESFISNLPMLILLFYIIFTVSNTMFSSKKDLEGAVELIFAAALIFGVLYLIGFRAPNIPLNIALLEKACLILLIPLTINALIIIFAGFLNKFLKVI
jgi:hypothetical protein